MAELELQLKEVRIKRTAYQETTVHQLLVQFCLMYVCTPFQVDGPSTVLASNFNNCERSIERQSAN